MASPVTCNVSVDPVVNRTAADRDTATIKLRDRTTIRPLRRRTANNCCPTVCHQSADERSASTSRCYPRADPVELTSSQHSSSRCCRSTTNNNRNGADPVEPSPTIKCCCHAIIIFVAAPTLTRQCTVEPCAVETRAIATAKFSDSNNLPALQRLVELHVQRCQQKRRHD